MALPASVQTITVTGRYTDFEGAPCTGSVTFTPECSCRLVADDGTVIAGSLTVPLDSNGALTVDLPASHQAALLPYDFCYEVTEEVSCLGCKRTYTIAVPVDGGPLDLSNVLNTI